MKERLEWRRNKVQELAVKGFNQADIAKMLQISEPTISRDVDYLKQSAKQEIKKHITDRLPYEYRNCIEGLTEIIREGWTIAAKTDKTGERLQSLALIKDTYSTKMELLTNANLLSDSIKFVEHTRDKILSNNNKKVNNNNIDMERSAETDSRTTTNPTDF
jgi:predicted transcriptional regulator